jgi:hypothetical protein
MAQQTSNVPNYSAERLLNMPQAQRQAYYQQLEPAARKKKQAAVANFQRSENNRYMKLTTRQKAVAMGPVGALSQTYSPGTVLTFNAQPTINGFAEGCWIRVTLTGTLAAGTSAVYAKNAGFPLTVFDRIQIMYNGVQHNFRPYILSTLRRMAGRGRSGIPLDVIAGQTVTTNDTYRDAGQPITAGAGNTWTFEFFVPFNLLGRDDPRGLMPIMAGETQLQIVLTCAPSANVMGNDPVLNLLAVVSGTGHTIAVTGTVAVYVQYRNGVSLQSHQTLDLELSGLKTTQLVQDATLTGLSNATTYRQKVGLQGRMPIYLLTLIDGNQANKFAANSNISLIELLADSVGQNAIQRYGSGTNMSVQEFFIDIFDAIEQDLDEGMIPIVRGPVTNVQDPDEYAGTDALVVGNAGWGGFNYGIQLATVAGAAGITPRVEAHAVLLNDPLVH